MVPLTGYAPMPLKEQVLAKITVHLWSTEEVSDGIVACLSNCRTRNTADNVVTNLTTIYNPRFATLTNAVLGNIDTLKLPSFTKDRVAESTREVGEHLRRHIWSLFCHRLFDVWFSEPLLTRWLILNLQYDPKGRVNIPKTNLSLVYNVPVDVNLKWRFVKACYFCRIDKIKELWNAMSDRGLAIQPQDLGFRDAVICKVWIHYLEIEGNSTDSRQWLVNETMLNAMEQYTYGQAFLHSVNDSENVESIEMLWDVMNEEERENQIRKLQTFGADIRFRNYWVFVACARKMDLDQRKRFYATRGKDLIYDGLPEDLIEPVLRFLAPFFLYVQFKHGLLHQLYQAYSNQEEEGAVEKIALIAKCVWNPASEQFKWKFVKDIDKEVVDTELSAWQILKFFSEHFGQILDEVQKLENAQKA